MALNIKNHEVEQLAMEVAALAKETKTEAIRRSLMDRKQRLLVRRVDAGKRERLLRLLESRIWPSIPADVLGKPVSKAEREAILGYGPEGF
jgi:antitoxin VapB